MRRRGRRLAPQEQADWQAVAATARPLVRLPRQVPEKPAAAEPSPATPPVPVTRRALPAKPAAPALQQKAPAPPANPVSMDARAWREMTRGRLRPEARLDLHGFTAAQAHGLLTRFITESHGRGRRLVLVITGKGRARDAGDPHGEGAGILWRQVPHWLAAPHLRSLILEVVRAHDRHGGDGALYVYLRRRK